MYQQCGYQWYTMATFVRAEWMHTLNCMKITSVDQQNTLWEVSNNTKSLIENE